MRRILDRCTVAFMMVPIVVMFTYGAMLAACEHDWWHVPVLLFDALVLEVGAVFIWVES